MQAQAQAQAQQAAEEACHLDAAAQQLQAEAHLVASKGSMAAHQHHPDQQYAGMSASMARSRSDAHNAAGQQQAIVVSSMQPQQSVHLQSCSPLEATALGMPHTELDDSQLILAAAEVRFEDRAAMADPQPSLPDTHDVLFKASQQYIAPLHQGIEHHAMAQRASSALQLAASAPGQLVQTASGFEHGLDSVQPVGGASCKKSLLICMCQILLLDKGTISNSLNRVR